MADGSVGHSKKKYIFKADLSRKAGHREERKLDSVSQPRKGFVHHFPTSSRCTDDVFCDKGLTGLTGRHDSGGIKR